MTKEKAQLLPCPFCGEEKIYINQPEGNFRGSINCPTCFATIPREVNNEELILTWNTRAATAAPTGDAADMDESKVQIAINNLHFSLICPPAATVTLEDKKHLMTLIRAATARPIREVTTLEAMPTQAVLIIKRMAAQKLFQEMDEDMLDEDGEINGCWQEGYESMVRMSREALALLEGGE